MVERNAPESHCRHCGDRIYYWPPDGPWKVPWNYYGMERIDPARCPANQAAMGFVPQHEPTQFDGSREGV